MRLGSGVLASAVAAMLVLALGTGLSAKALPEDVAERKLGVDALVGIWDCKGTSNTAAVTAKLRWYHLEDHSLWMTLHPTPDGKTNQTYLEKWEWEDNTDTYGGTDWRTDPDPKSFDAASYTSSGNGFVNGKMVWIRHAQASTESRVFTQLGKDHLSFHESYGDPGTPPHVVYDLDCRRTAPGEPTPA